jgi:hypothetical protein
MRTAFSSDYCCILGDGSRKGLLNPLMEMEGLKLFSLQSDDSVTKITTAPRTIIDLSPT